MFGIYSVFLYKLVEFKKKLCKCDVDDFLNRAYEIKNNPTKYILYNKINYQIIDEKSLKNYYQVINQIICLNINIIIYIYEKYLKNVLC